MNFWICMAWFVNYIMCIHRDRLKDAIPVYINRLLLVNKVTLKNWLTWFVIQRSNLLILGLVFDISWIDFFRRKFLAFGNYTKVVQTHIFKSKFLKRNFSFKSSRKLWPMKSYLSRKKRILKNLMLLLHYLIINLLF